MPLEKIGTDPNQATNWAFNTYDLTKIGLQKETPAYLGVNTAVNPIRRQLYADFQIPESEQQPDLSAQAPCGYKARPLIGVWATPPFLHNGSVRTVFDLLSETRPDKFTYGTREYDPVNLGYTEDPSANDAVLDTSISGNHNTGHWWTDDERPGRIGRKLTDDEKYAIIEYLKAANYDNYRRKSGRRRLCRVRTSRIGQSRQPPRVRTRSLVRWTGRDDRLNTAGTAAMACQLMPSDGRLGAVLSAESSRDRTDPRAANEHRQSSDRRAPVGDCALTRAAIDKGLMDAAEVVAALDSVTAVAGSERNGPGGAAPIAKPFAFPFAS